MAKRTFDADGIAISYDSDVCQHSGTCVRGLPSVFNAKANPWIQPGEATPEEVARQVAACPSGALQVERLGDAG